MAFGKLVQDLAEADQDRLRCQKAARNVLDFAKHGGKEVPRAPSQTFVDREWRAARDGIRDAVGHESGPLTALAQHSLATHVDILFDRELSHGELDDWVFDRASLVEQPHAAQVLMGAVFCQSMFARPEPMCVDEYGGILMAHYKTMAVTGTSTCTVTKRQNADVDAEGLQRIRELDHVGTHLFFVNSASRNTIQRRITALSTRFIDTLKVIVENLITSVDDQYDSQSWTQRAIKLKQELLLSPADYRIRLCLPGVAINSLLMTAENSDGFEIPPAEKVAMCLWPAITQQDAGPLGRGDDISVALVKNKSFFPSRKEKMKFDVGSTVSKAVVLLAD